ncbi:MAG TPA: ROK family protein [Candidatus Polarisedimenticolia bacterium]|nr:ROK family protein [Candidatus Polarisedimenticolia bacterium]
MRPGATLGLDLGGSKLLAVVVGGDGTVLDRERLPTGRTTGPGEAIALARQAAGALRARGADFAAAGLGFPGLVDHSAGLVRSSVMLDDWKDVRFADRLSEALAVPCLVDNDVNMAAFAEIARRRTDGDPPATTIFVFVGTGIGGAIAIDGALYRGPGGLAGEIGNTTVDHAGEVCWCGRRGCLNTLASGSAIAAALGNGGTALAERFLNGDPVTVRVVERAAHWLGVGLGNAINLLNPALVVLGGGVAELGPRYLATVRQAALRESFAEAAGACRFELARAGYEAGALGAGLMARPLAAPGAA